MAVGKYAFVVPRFGENIAGGAETLVAQLAKELAKRGDKITILTTCALDNRTWENYFPAEQSEEYGLEVYRFPVDQRDLDVWVPLQIKISEGMMLSVEDQLNWMAESVNSTGLYEHILNYSANYDAIFFAPYLFGTTFWGSAICPEKSILIPCLHDEYYAYTEVMCSMFRRVKGALFNANAEKDLMQSLVGDVVGAEVGMGFVGPSAEEVDSLKPYFEDNFPYMVYLGRKESGKNLHLLIEYFTQYKSFNPENQDLKFVIVGGGSISDVASEGILSRGDIIDLNQVSEKDKQRLVKYSNFLCQPSTNESFSIVLMEAWMLKTPVLVHANCAVTKSHVIESSGGLYFADLDDFCSVVDRLVEDPKLCSSLGLAGKDYVAKKYSWDSVLERFDQAMKTIA